MSGLVALRSTPIRRIARVSNAPSVARSLSTSISRTPLSLASRQRPSQLARPSLVISRRCLSTEQKADLTEKVNGNSVVLFMKGTPEMPQCGFSRAVIQILELQQVPPEKLSTYNVLESSELRQNVKEFSEWPTVPQLYVNGEFVGGCDIVLGMHQSGELETLLENKGVIPKIEQ